jgi:Rrf2 family protein
MIFCSHASELAVCAAIHLALQPPGKLSPVHEIAAGTGLPAPYLAKIMRQLIRAGLVRAFRGPGGGVELGQPAESITLSSLVKAVEGRAAAEACILGLGDCSETMPCPLHSQWVPMRNAVRRMLEETSLAALATAARERPDFLNRRLHQEPQPAGKTKSPTKGKKQSS